MKNTIYYCLVIFGLFACSQTTEEKESDSRPNIIYIMADDLGYGDIGPFGQTKVKTPNLDILAKGGMRLTQHYAGSTVCAPSRASVMTGMHTGHTVVRGNREVKPEGQAPMPGSSITLAEKMQEAGYTTAAFGKWGLGFPGSEGDPNMQGFETFFGYNCQRHAHGFYPSFLRYNQDSVHFPGNFEGQRNTYSADVIADSAINFLTREAMAQKTGNGKPFFLFLPFTIPHAEMLVPQQYMDEYGYTGAFPEKPFPGGHYAAQETPHAAFAAMVTRLDAHIGMLMEVLRTNGLEENTLIIFTSDNGPHVEGGHDPDFFDSNGPYKGYKRDLYEGGIRVPSLAYWPGKIAAGTDNDHISAFWDMMPTLCEVAGIEPPADIDGISFLPSLLGENDQEEHAYLYWEFHERGGKQAIRQGKWKAIRLGVRKNPSAPIELYDLEEDPEEENNIAATHPEKVAEMEKLMSEAHQYDENWPLFDGEGEN